MSAENKLCKNNKLTNERTNQRTPHQSFVRVQNLISFFRSYSLVCSLMASLCLAMNEIEMSESKRCTETGADNEMKYHNVSMCTHL